MSLAGTLRTAVVLALVLPSLGGCYVLAGGALAGAAVGAASAGPSTAIERGLAGAAVTVDFARPRDVIAAAPGARDSVHASQVRRVLGRVRAAHGDTLHVLVSRLHRERGAPLAFDARAEPLALIVPDESTRVHVLAANPDRVQRSVLGAAIGFVGALVAVFAYCHQSPCSS